MLRLLSQLKSGDIDAILLIGKNPEREKLYQYAALPYLELPARPRDAEGQSACRRSRPTDDIAGMHLGTAEGAVVVDFVKTRPRSRGTM